jgi:hypothetical protein
VRSLLVVACCLEKEQRASGCSNREHATTPRGQPSSRFPDGSKRQAICHPDVAMQKNVTGYQYWFHRQLDFRTLAKQ